MPAALADRLTAALPTGQERSTEAAPSPLVVALEDAGLQPPPTPMLTVWPTSGDAPTMTGTETVTGTGPADGEPTDGEPTATDT